MTNPYSSGSAKALAPPFGEFSTVRHTSACPARVVGWRQERPAIATRSAPTGNRQGGTWGSTT